MEKALRMSLVCRVKLCWVRHRDDSEEQSGTAILVYTTCAVEHGTETCPVTRKSFSPRLVRGSAIASSRGNIVEARRTFLHQW